MSFRVFIIGQNFKRKWLKKKITIFTEINDLVLISCVEPGTIGSFNFISFFNGLALALNAK